MKPLQATKHRSVRPGSAAESVDQNTSFDSVDKTLLIHKFLLFTVNGYVFRHLYQSHHQAKPLHAMTHTHTHTAKSLSHHLN